MGSSLSSSFEVFHTLLARNLEAVAGATSSTQLARLAADMLEACTTSQHTYAHTQLMLARLAESQGGGLFRRLAQDLEAAAVARHGGAAVWAMQPLFVPPSAPPQRREVVRLVSRALIISSSAGSDAMSQVSLWVSAVMPSHGCSNLSATTPRSCWPYCPLSTLQAA